MSVWTFDVTQGRAGLDALQPAWDALARTDARLAFYRCAAWSRAFLDHLAPAADDLLWVSGRRDGVLALVLPLERTGTELRLFTHDHMTLADVLAPAQADEVWPLLWAWLSGPQGPGCRRLLLPAITQDSTLAAWLQHDAPALAVRRELEGCAWLDTRQSYEQLLKASSANHRSNLARGRKRAGQRGRLRYESHAGAPGVAAAMADFLAIEASGWKGQEGGAVACRAELMAFYAQLGEQLGAHDPASTGCEIDLLWLDDRVISTIFWFRSGATLHLQKIAYLEELSELGPGRLIMAEALQRACADPALQRVSFITRCPWADGWRTQIMPVTAWTLWPTGWRGRLGHVRTRGLMALKQRVKPWLARLRG
jgi:CelD/BcsL family acetyltransferase involved in cellulose biosynthesis